MDIELAHLAGLAGGDCSRLDADAAILELQRLERALARLHALRHDLLIAAAQAEPRIDEYRVPDPRPGAEGDRALRIADAACEEIAAALRWSPMTARRRVREARILTALLPDTHQALRTGAISERHAAEIVEAAQRLRPEGECSASDPAYRRHCRELERRVLPVARRGTAAQCRASARRAVLAIDSASAQERRRRAQCTRDVHCYDDIDGISTIIARMATEEAHGLMRTVQARADLLDDPAFTAGERRAQALSALLQEATGGPSGTASRVRLDVVVGLESLLTEPGRGTALLDEVAVPMEAVRDLLADPQTEAVIRRLVTDPVTGHLLDVGRRSYECPDRLREFIVARDRTCRFPGCRLPAERCDIDHAVPWDEGGASNRANLGALCRRHHQLKTHGGWLIVESAEDGSCTWLSPARRAYRHLPEPVAPESTVDPPPF